MLDVSLQPRATVWRGPGRSRREIPEEIRKLADSTYKTGHVITVTIGPDDEEDVRELQNLLTSYARSQGHRLRAQRDEDVARFEMVPVAPRQRRGSQ